jgi:transposase-like protein
VVTFPTVRLLSDSVDEAYEKYVMPHSNVEAQDPGKVTCPKCDSDNVDRSSGYRGEYKCMACGYHWQVGGWQAT